MKKHIGVFLVLLLVMAMNAWSEDKTIDDLDAKTTPVGADKILIWDVAGSATKSATFSNLATYRDIAPSANIQTFLGSANYAAMREYLALRPGVEVQVYDADLGTIAAVTGTQGDILYYTTASGWVDLAAPTHDYVLRYNTSTNIPYWGVDTGGSGSGEGDMISTSYPNIVAIEAEPVTNTYMMVADGSQWQSVAPSSVRSNLGLVIGTNVQAYDADLTTWAGVTPSSNGQSLVAAADYSAMRTLLSLVPGTNIQAYDADLLDIAAISDQVGDLMIRGDSGWERLACPAGNYVLRYNTSTNKAYWGVDLSYQTPTNTYMMVANGTTWTATSPSDVRTNLSLVPGTNVQVYDADLDTWSGITPGSNVGTWLATPSSANLASAVTGETGSGALVFGTSPTIASPTITSASMTTPTLGAALATSIQFTDQNASPSTVGVLQYDNTVTGLDDGAFVWYDDDEIQTVISLDSSATLGSGQDGYQITYHYNSGNGYWDLQTPGAGSLANIVEDTTPQLGGALDVNSQEIQSAGNIVFQLGDAAGTYKLSLQDSDSSEVAYFDSDGVLHAFALVVGTGGISATQSYTTAGKVSLYELAGDTSGDSDNTITIQGQDSLSTDYTITVPGADGTLLLSGASWSDGYIPIMSSTALIGDAGLVYNTSTNILTATGGFSTSGDITVSGDDLSLLSDAAVLNFGADSDVKLTHVADTGLLLNTAMQMQFRDSAIHIESADDGHLDLTADTSIDLNGAVVASGTVGVATSLNPDASDGATLGTSSLEWSDLFLADAAVINLGDDQDVTLTHVADTGILLSSTDQFQFGDSGTYINQGADGHLDLTSDTSLDLNVGSEDLLLTSSENAIAIGTGTSVAGITLTSLNLTVGGDLTVSGDDITMGTNTAGYILVGDDTNYNPVAVSGDATLASTGALTIANDAITMAKLDEDGNYTDWTGNWTFSTGTLTLANGAVISDAKTLTFDEAAADPDDADVVFSGADGVLTIAAANGANNENLTFDFDAASNKVTVNTGTSVSELNISAINLVTSGTIAGRVPIAQKDAAGAISAAECAGYVVVMTTTGTLTLPAAATAGYGAIVVVRARDAEVVTIDPDGVEIINLGGTALTAGYAIKSDGSAGSQVTLMSVTDTGDGSTDGWLVMGVYPASTSFVTNGS